MPRTAFRSGTRTRSSSVPQTGIPTRWCCPERSTASRRTAPRAITIPKKPVEATIPYSTGLSLRQAMAALGGPTPYAAAGAAFIIRADAGRVSFDAGAIWEGSRPDIPLRVNDRVVVPIDRVTVSVTGAVELPGEYELLRGATVADLVNQAGGPTPYANRRRIMVRQPDISGDYVSMPVTFEEGMLVMLRDNAVVRVLSSYGSGSAIVVEGAVYGKPIDGEGPITLPTALPAAASELRAGLPAPVPVRLVLPFFPGMTAYDALYAVGGPTPFARAEDSYRRPLPASASSSTPRRSGTETPSPATSRCNRATSSWCRPPKCS